MVLVSTLSWVSRLASIHVPYIISMAHSCRRTSICVRQPVGLFFPVGGSIWDAALFIHRGLGPSHQTRTRSESVHKWFLVAAVR